MLVTADTPTLPPMDLQVLEDAVSKLELTCQVQLSVTAMILGCLVIFVFCFFLKR